MISEEKIKLQQEIYLTLSTPDAYRTSDPIISQRLKKIFISESPVRCTFQRRLRTSLSINIEPLNNP